MTRPTQDTSNPDSHTRRRRESTNAASAPTSPRRLQPEDAYEDAPAFCFPSPTTEEDLADDIAPVQCFPNTFPFNLFSGRKRRSSNASATGFGEWAEEGGGYPSHRPLMPFDGCLIVFVVGGPGSGKGTNCERLAERFQLVHVSTGDLLREEVKRGGDFANDILDHMKNGEMVPIEITKRLLLRSMEKAGRGVPGFLIDGFPRLLEQAYEFENSIGRCTICLFYDCPEEVLIHRLLERGKSSGRADDNLETIKKRIELFYQETMPVVQFYDRYGRVRRVDSDAPPDVVMERSLNVFRQLNSRIFT